MGFGYNGSLEKSGERLDMLDFFSWMKQTQREWSIWDASAYYIVNKTSPKKIQKLGDNPSAKNILDVLVNEQERPKRAEIIRNCDLRSLYLKRLIELSNIDNPDSLNEYFFDKLSFNNVYNSF